jgi:glycosyltransferase involved in cell wall biosynthesis
MKVLLVSTVVYTIPVETYGGLERQVELLARGLVEKGHEVAVATPKGSRPPVEGVEIIETVSPASETGRMDWIILELEAMQVWKHRAKDFDIIHSHEWSGAAYLVKRDNPDLNLKVIHTSHGHLTWRTPPPVPYPNLCAVSNFLANEISSQLGVPVKAVHNGINLDEFEFREEKEDFLLFVGRFTPYKQPHLVIELCKELNMKGILVGQTKMVEDANYVYDIMRRCAMTGGLVRFFGTVSNEVRNDLMSKAKAIIVPSNFKEPLGLVSLEAQACGTPAIVADDGGLPETVRHGKTGFVCRSFEDYVEAVKNLDKIDPKKCRKNAEKFDYKVMTEKYIKLYEQILNEVEW